MHNHSKEEQKWKCLPEPASYVFFYAVFNLRNLLYLIALRGYHRRQSVGLFPLLIPGPQKILYFFFGCRADGRSALIDRFAAVWATVRQRLCFNAVFC